MKSEPDNRLRMLNRQKCILYTIERAHDPPDASGPGWAEAVREILDCTCP